MTNISCSELRSRGKALYKQDLSYITLMYLLMGVIGVALGFTMLGSLLAGVLVLGFVISLKKVRSGQEHSFGDLFKGFDNFATGLVTYILTSLFTFFWSLLFIIPGIIASIRYSMVYYIIADNPTCTATEAIKRSSDLINGYKGKYFLLMLSFIGWSILCVFTLGIGYIFLMPYIESTKLEFYHYLLEVKGMLPQEESPKIEEHPVDTF